jgi:NTE family protein
MTKRALVLGGGGPLAIAWETGLLAGLDASGLDLSGLDLILGTSAGSFVGAQLAMGRAPAKMAQILMRPGRPGPLGHETRNEATAPGPDLSFLIDKLEEAFSGTRPAQEVRAEIGTWALNAHTVTEETFIASFGGWLKQLPPSAWPERNYACTAVDAADGSFKVWNKDAGVGLARAVASSCSVPGIFPPITILGQRYIDGGMRSPTNADVAKGYDLVIVVLGAVIHPSGSEPFASIVGAELGTLRKGGSRVELITPDPLSIEAFGRNPMDARRSPAVAQAGLDQGKRESARLLSLWGRDQ